MTFTNRIAAFALALCVPAAVPVPLAAQEPDATEVAAGMTVICDTASQIDRLVALHNDGAELPAALQRINNEQRNPNACGMAVVMFSLGRSQQHVMLQGRAIDIVEITIHAVNDGTRWSRVPGVRQFTLLPEKSIAI
ncbi:MAG: hypothetical protein AB7K04_14625 [Pseudorhodoplanes sp.]